MSDRRDNSKMLFATPAIVADRRADGTIWLKSTAPLQSAARCVGDWLEHWARQTPERIFLAPLAQDIVVTGHGGDHVRFLVFPNIVTCRALAGLPDSADANEVIGHEKVRAGIAQGLARLKAQNGSGSSAHATRALLLAEPASVDGGEITDKGYINQRAVLTRRAAAVATPEDDALREWIGCPG